MRRAIKELRRVSEPLRRDSCFLELVAFKVNHEWSKNLMERKGPGHSEYTAEFRPDARKLVWLLGGQVHDGKC